MKLLKTRICFTWTFLWDSGRGLEHGVLNRLPLSLVVVVQVRGMAALDLESYQTALGQACFVHMQFS